MSIDRQERMLYYHGCLWNAPARVAGVQAKMIREEFPVSADEIFDKVQDIIAEQFSVNKEEVTQDSLLEDDLGADSVDLVDLAVTLEQEFNLEETEESVLSAIKTVGDVVDYIARALAE